MRASPGLADRKIANGMKEIYERKRESESERGFSLSNVDHPFRPARTLPSYLRSLSIIVAFTVGRVHFLRRNRNDEKKKKEKKMRENGKLLAVQTDL